MEKKCTGRKKMTVVTIDESGNITQKDHAKMMKRLSKPVKMRKVDELFIPRGVISEHYFKQK